jgi:phosphoenolpyruvate carboxylase
VSVTPAREPIDHLRDDVRLLGSLLGDVIREQGGGALFSLVEEVRHAAIGLRERSDPNAEQALARRIDELPLSDLFGLVRACATASGRPRRRRGPSRSRRRWPRRGGRGSPRPRRRA